MRFRRLAWLLTLACACDKISSQSSDAVTGDAGLLGATKIATTQGTYTLDDQSLISKFPLALMPESRVEDVHRLEKPGKPAELSLSLEAPAPLQRTAEYYENAMKRRGMRVQSSMSAKDPNQVFLMGESPSAVATAMLNRKMGGESTSVALSWVDKDPASPATTSAPAARR